jgi:hypothetical protein
LENKLQKVKEVFDKKIFVACQQNSWFDQDIFLKWYNEIYLKYEIFQEKKKCFLILDYAPSHKSDYIIEEFQKTKQNLSLFREELLDIYNHWILELIKFLNKNLKNII